MKIVGWKNGLISVRLSRGEANGEDFADTVLVVERHQFNGHERSFVSCATVLEHTLGNSEHLVSLDVVNIHARQWPVLTLACSTGEHGLALIMLAIDEDRAMLLLKTPRIKVANVEIALASVFIGDGPCIVLHDSQAVYSFSGDHIISSGRSSSWCKHDVIMLGAPISQSAFISCQHCCAVCCAVTSRTSASYCRILPERVAANGSEDACSTCPNPNCVASSTLVHSHSQPFPSAYCPVVSCMRVIPSDEYTSSVRAGKEAAASPQPALVLLLGTTLGQFLLVVNGQVEWIWSLEKPPSSLLWFVSNRQLVVAASCGQDACSVAIAGRAESTAVCEPCLAVTVGDTLCQGSPQFITVQSTTCTNERYTFEGQLLDGRTAIQFGQHSMMEEEEDENSSASRGEGYTSAVHSLQQQWQESMLLLSHLRQQQSMKRAQLQAACDLASQMSSASKIREHVTGSSGAEGSSSLVCLISGKSKDVDHMATSPVPDTEPSELPLSVKMFPTSDTCTSLCSSCTEKTYQFEICNRSSLPVRDIVFLWASKGASSMLPIIPSVRTASRSIKPSFSSEGSVQDKLSPSKPNSLAQATPGVNMPAGGDRLSRNSSISCLLPGAICQVTVSFSSGFSVYPLHGDAKELSLNDAYLECAYLSDGIWQRTIHALPVLMA